MITKFKIFENVSSIPKVGDYILMNLDIFSKTRQTWINALSSIAQIVEVQDDFFYRIKFDIIEGNPEFENGFDKEGCRTFHLSYLKYWSEDKDELEALVSSKKYNL